MMDKTPKKKTVSVNLSHALFSLLDFLALKDGNNRFCRNIGTELPVSVAYYLTRAQISYDDLAMQTLV
jgi:hypothetical protein